jgi:hypothetical protein
VRRVPATEIEALVDRSLREIYGDPPQAVIEISSTPISHAMKYRRNLLGT